MEFSAFFIFRWARAFFVRAVFAALPGLRVSIINALTPKPQTLQKGDILINMNKFFWLMAAGGMMAFAACTAQTPPKPTAAPAAGAPTAVSASGVFSGSVSGPTKPVTATVIAGGIATPKPGSTGLLTGTVTYKERIALSPNSIATVRLVDVTQADAPGIVLAEQVIKNPVSVPIKYELKYDTSRISAKNRYAVQAAITDAAGKITWANETRYPALTGGAPLSNLEIVVKQGAVPAATVAQATATPAPVANATAAATAKPAATAPLTPTAKVEATAVPPAATATAAKPITSTAPVTATPKVMPTVVVTATAVAPAAPVTPSVPVTGAAPSGSMVITGTASYAQNLALAPDATVSVALYEMSPAGVGIRVISRKTMSVTGSAPVAWEVAYDPAKVVAGKRYGVIVTVTSGKNIYRNSRPLMVISRAGETASVNVAMRKIR